MIETSLPISEVARRFDIRASALRYYEEIGLLKPTVRLGGRRYYGPVELKRLVLIQLLQDAGRLSLEEIAEVLASKANRRSSRKVLHDRVAILNDQIRVAEAARDYLEYRLSCPREDPFDGCPALAEELSRRFESAENKQGMGTRQGQSRSKDPDGPTDPTKHDAHAKGAHDRHCYDKHSRAEVESSNGMRKKNNLVTA